MDIIWTTNQMDIIWTRVLPEVWELSQDPEAISMNWSGRERGSSLSVQVYR